MNVRNRVLHIGELSVTDILSRYGSPVYVYDAAIIRRQIERVRSAFSRLPFRPFYAMKANSSLAILDLVRKSGFGCDAVSPGEIYIARQAGYTPDNIWFTCSNVSDDDLRSIGDPEIVINVNSMSEIDRILALDLPNPIALRVNPDIGAGHHADVVTAGAGVKFGIDLAEIDEARTVVEDSGRRVVGLHAHIGSGVDQLAPLLESARRLLELAGSYANLRFINFGGGMSIPYRPGEAEFPIEEYGEELTRIAAHFLRARDLTAILEPGRYVVAQSGVLLATVTSKRISTGTEWIGVDTGFNHLVRPSKYGAYHHIINATNASDGALRESFDESQLSEECVVAGNICESSDVFTRSASGAPETRRIDRTKVGDAIAFCDAGAYGFSMASHYNARLLPPEVLVDGASMQLIRDRQTFDDLVRGQR
ncbi:MAG: diaminopimelate decarboxylase [Acidobacteriota bacterium]|jgi:diaminopimelate decarboxylase|nr:diaminopimelate decarboxylase [Acidobacteriota bacterium]